MKKPIIQVSFSLKNGLTIPEIRTKLIQTKEKLDKQYQEYEIHSCHLSREICIAAGFGTEVPDMFEEIFGKDYVCEITEKTKEAAFANINKHRKELSRKADRLVILSEEQMTNVALEIQLFTHNSIIIV